MNVKANGILARNSKVKDFFVPLSPGDETNVFGGGYLATEDFFKKIIKIQMPYHLFIVFI